MNFLLASDKENAEKRAGMHSCLYCKKVFNNHRALGGHLRAHQEEINARRSWNYPVRSSNSIGVTSINPNPLSMGQPEYSSGGAGNNPSTPFSKATSPMDFSKFYSNESGWVSASKYSENNVGNAKPQFFMSPTLPSSTCGAEIHHSNTLSSAVFPPSGNTAATSFPIGPSLYLSSYGICQFNTDQLRTFRDGMPFYSSRDAFPDFQHHNLSSKLSYPAYSISDPDSGLGSNQLHGLKEPNTVSSLPLSHGQYSGQTGVGQYNKSSMSTCEGGKKRCLGEVLGNADMMNTSKRPQISPNLSAGIEKSQKKELLLFKDVEDSFSGLGISFDVKGEGEADLDLSLHL